MFVAPCVRATSALFGLEVRRFALTAAAALALAEHGIRMNAIAPGTIDTQFAASVRDDPAILANTLSRIPLGRLGEPAEIGALACFLASDGGSYITGQTIFADAAAPR